MEKVLELLKRLESKLEGESEEEAAQYDKFACFCKEQLDEKVYAITKSAKKANKLEAEANELRAQIAEHNDDIRDINEEITALKEQIDELTEARERSHKLYVVEEADLSSAIDSLERAIDAMESSKDDMKDAKYDLVQLRSVADTALKVAAGGSRSRASEKQMRAVASLAQLVQNPAVYEYESSSVLATLEDMLKIFVENKKEIDTAEFNKKAEFEKALNNLENMKKFAEKDKAKLEKFVAMKSDQEAEATQEAEREKADMEKDGAFLGRLKAECEEKAKLWDMRSKTRAAELQQISKAMKILQSEVAPKYKVNEKLVDLQTRRVHAAVATPAPASSGREVAPKHNVSEKLVDSQTRRGHAAVARPAPASSVRKASAPSFLQLRGANVGSSGEVSAAATVRDVVEFLTTSANSLSSGALVAAAGRVAAVEQREDHFVKVRTVIKDLLKKMAADAEAEATQKSFCDKSMKETTGNRDNAQAEVESLTAAVSKENIRIKELMKAIAELSEDIARLKKELLEATQLREEESAENEKKRATAKAGALSVGQALEVLGEFYSLAETGHARTRYEPPGGDREGNTFDDKAPKIFDDKYGGDGQSSKGIIGLLEVIQEDFTRTDETIEVEERAAVEAFEKLKGDIEGAIEEKSGSKEEKEGSLKIAQDDLIEYTDDLEEQTKLFKTAKDLLVKLKKQCVDGEETYEERVAKRKKEIEALKQAHALLEDWKQR